MLNMKKFFLCTMIICAAALQSGCSEEEDNKAFEKAHIEIVTPEKEVHRFEVELAETPEQQQLGLMHRESMAGDKGMLFIFSQESNLGFWMKNTLIPLDMLFIDEDGFINHIHPMAKPLDLTTVRSTSPAKAVLEINGGIAEKLGITEGSRVIHPAFVKGK